jgi:hypothetical protein
VRVLARATERDCQQKKKGQVMQRKLAIFIMVLPFLFTACGGSSSNTVTPSGSIAGNWQMSLQPTNSNESPRTQSGFLLQSVNAVTGSLLLTDSPCTAVGNVSGTLSGTNVSMVVDPNGVQVNLTGTVGSGQSSMTGDYTILSTGCSAAGASPDTGTWTATLVPPFTGNLSGTFTSHTGTTYAATGMLTQGSNTGLSNAPVTGTLNLTGYCFATANIVGTVSGTNVVLNFVDPDGTQLGELYATSSTDATSMTGTYEYIGEGTGAPKGCTGDDHGTITLTLQGS